MQTEMALCLRIKMKLSLVLSVLALAGSSDGNECLQDLTEVFNSAMDFSTGQHQNDWAWQMIDSSGKIPDGLFKGALYSPGLPYECLGIQIPPSKNATAEQPSSMKPSYCVVDFRTPDNWEGQTSGIAAILPSGIEIENGFCVPESCSDSQATFQDVLHQLLETNGIYNISVSIKKCISDFEYGGVKGYQYAAIAFIACMLFITLIGTLLDVLLARKKSSEDKRLQGKIAKTFLAFSVYSNTKSFLNLKSPKGSIDCMNGIRFLSLMWVFFGHSYSNNARTKIYTNSPDFFLGSFQQWLFQIVFSGSAAVNTFFTLSGLLVAYVLLKELDRSKGKFNIFHYYLHRYARLTPLYAVCMLLLVSVFPMLSGAPRLHEKLWRERMLDQCKSWWAKLLYMNNWIPDQEWNFGYCLDHGWYLTVDMQLYILAPLVVIPLHYMTSNDQHRKEVKKYGPHCWMLMWILGSIFGSVCVRWAHPAIAPTSLAGFFGQDPNKGDPNSWQYGLLPYTRFGPYVIGIYAGFIMHKVRTAHIKIRLKPWFVIASWCLIIAITCVVVWGDSKYFVLNEQRDVMAMPIMSTERDIWFSVIMKKTLWSVAICGMVMLCQYGYGGPISSFLSWNPFVPLSRLSYCTYLIHVPMMWIYWQTRVTTYHMDTAEQIFDFLGHVGVTLMAAFFMSMVFEFPMVKLEKIWLFPRTSPKNNAA